MKKELGDIPGKTQFKLSLYHDTPSTTAYPNKNFTMNIRWY